MFKWNGLLTVKDHWDKEDKDTEDREERRVEVTEEREEDKCKEWNGRPNKVLTKVKCMETKTKDNRTIKDRCLEEDKDKSIKVNGRPNKVITKVKWEETKTKDKIWTVNNNGFNLEEIRTNTIKDKDFKTNTMLMLNMDLDRLLIRTQLQEDKELCQTDGTFHLVSHMLEIPNNELFIVTFCRF